MTRPALRTPSYRTRLIAGFMLVVVLLGGAWAWSLYSPMSATVESQQRQRLTDLARASAVALGSSDAAIEVTVRELAGDGSVRVTVVAADGVVLADSEEPTGTLENHGDRPEVAAALAGTVGTDVRISGTQGVERMYAAVPGTYAGKPVAVRTSETAAQIGTIAADARSAGLALLAVMVALAAATAWLVTHTAAGPVERLARAATAMADGNLSWHVPDGGPALRPLSLALTELRSQLRARLAAQEAEERTLRAALDGLTDGVLLLDGTRVRLANRALTALFRTPPGPLEGRPLSELGLPAPIESAITGALAAGESTQVQLGPDPFQRYHRIMVVPLGDDDGDARALVVASDETDRMRLDAVRRDFVANASHELKTPTAAIALLAESAASASSDGDTDQALAFVAQAGEEAARLRSLVADLLDLSRLESVPTADEVTDVRHGIELALAGHRRAAAAKGLVLAADLSAVDGSDVAVRAGATDLAIVLDNLLSNAITYTEHGRVTVSVAADASEVAITVADTGIGIPAPDVERVFERFYRVDRARSRTSGGTGLGLALVRNIAERAGGTVDITSETPGGTAVTIRLPRAL